MNAPQGYELPALSDELLEFAASSDFETVRAVEGNLAAWVRTIPGAYDWVTDPGPHESLRSEVFAADGTLDFEAVQAFARALGRDMQAYSTMQLWKTLEMVKGSVTLLNAGMVAAAAAPARSALESAVSLRTMTYRFASWLLGKGETSPSEWLDELEEFRDLLRALIWGGKSRDAAVEGRNVLTFKDALVKRLEDGELADELERTYEELCDVVHPSATGHQVWWGTPLRVEEDSAQLVPLHFNEPGDSSEDVTERVLWAISFASSVTLRSFAGTWYLADPFVKAGDSGD